MIHCLSRHQKTRHDEKFTFYFNIFTYLNKTVSATVFFLIPSNFSSQKVDNCGQRSLNFIIKQTMKNTSSAIKNGKNVGLVYQQMFSQQIGEYVNYDICLCKSLGATFIFFPLLFIAAPEYATTDHGVIYHTRFPFKTTFKSRSPFNR